jgi:hypothetical protein
MYESDEILADLPLAGSELIGAVLHAAHRGRRALIIVTPIVIIVILAVLLSPHRPG